MLEDKIQKRFDYLFCFSLGSYVVDQRSGDGRFNGWIEVIAISCRQEVPEFRNTGREDRLHALNKIIQNSHFKKKVSLEEQKAQKEDRFLRERQIGFMIYDYFRVAGARDTVLD